MPFLEELGRRMTSTMDLSRLQSAVNEEERVRQELYRSIGERYLALHKEDPEEALLPLANAVAASFSRTEEYQRLIRNVKGLVQCPNCGKDVESTVMFCMHCGARMPIPEPPKNVGKFCTACGAPIPEGAKFCFKCGQPVQQAVPAASLTPASAEQLPEEVSAAETPAAEES